MELENARVLVTGASRGIGRALATHFARSGAAVALVARSPAPLQDLATDLGGRAYLADLTDTETLRELLPRIEADGPIDVLVNKAGDECIGRFTEMDADTLRFIVDLNVVAGAELTRQAVPGMLERGRGHVVGISSFAGVTTPPMLAAYAATKAFVTHHSVNLRFELKDTPIGVTKVEIGEVSDTGLMEKGRADAALAGLFDRMYRLRLSRLISPDEIAAATLRAVVEDKASARLPRRLALSSLLADAPRRATWALAHGLTSSPHQPSSRGAS